MLIGELLLLIFYKGGDILLTVLRKIPINPEIFGDFKRGQRLKTGLIYFWFRARTNYDVNSDIEYYSFEDGKPYNNLFYINTFKYGKNQITNLLKPLIENKLIVVNKELQRYEFPQDSFTQGQWTLIDIELLQDLVDYCIMEKDNTNRHCGTILVWGYLHNKFNLFGVGQHIFCYKDINTYLGYDDKSKTDTGKRIITLLEDNKLIKDVPSNDAKGIYKYYSYKQLLEVNESLEENIAVPEEPEEEEVVIEETIVPEVEGFHLYFCGDKLFTVEEVREFIIKNPKDFIEDRLLKLPENYQKVIDSGLNKEFPQYFGF